MTSADPGDDLVPCMRSVQLSDGDKQLMSAFKNKVDDGGQYEAERRPLYRGANIPSRLFRELDHTVDGETDTYLHSESDPRYKGAHIPSRTFRILQAATGGAEGVSGGAPPSSSRIGGPGQNRTVVVTMPAGGASGPAVPPSQQEVPEPRKYTGGHIPSRSFQMLQQMTADDQAFRRLGLPFGRDVIRGSSDVTGGSSDVTWRQRRRRAWLLHADLPATAPSPSTPPRVSSRTSSGLSNARNTEEEEPVKTPGHSRLARLLSSFEDDERDSRVPNGAPVKESGRCGSVREAAVTAVGTCYSNGSDDTGCGKSAYGAPAKDRVTVSRENFRSKRNGNACVPNCNRYSEYERRLPWEALKSKQCQGLCRKDVCHRPLESLDNMTSPVRPNTGNNSGGGRGVRMSSINSIGSVSSVSSGFGDGEEIISEPELEDDEHVMENTDEPGGEVKELVNVVLDANENEAESVNRQEYVKEEHCAPASYRRGHTQREPGRGGQDCRDLVGTGDDAKHCHETDGNCDESDTDTDTETDSESGSETDSHSESDSESESLSHSDKAFLEEGKHAEPFEKGKLQGDPPNGGDLATSSEEDDEEESTVTSEDDVTLARSRSVTPDVTLLTTERSMILQERGVGQSSSNGSDKREDEECLLKSRAKEEEEEVQEQQEREVEEERADEDQGRRELEALVADIWRSRREFDAGENDGELLFQDKREQEFDNWLQRLEQRNERLKAMVAPPVADSGTREAFSPVTEEGLVSERMKEEPEEVTEVRAHGDEEIEGESEESGDENEIEIGMTEEKEEHPNEAAKVDDRIVDRVVGNVLDLATGALADEDRTSEENRVLRGRKERDKDGIHSQMSIDCTPEIHNTFPSDNPNNNVQESNAAKVRLRISVESKGVQTDDLSSIVCNGTVHAAPHSTAPCKRHVPHVIISTPDREMEVDVLLESPDATSGPYEVWGECYSKVFRPVPPGNRPRARENTNTRFAAASGASSMVKDSLCNVRDSVSDVKDSVSEVKDSLSEVKDFVTKVKAAHCYVTGEPLSLSSHASVKAAHSAQSQPQTQRRGHVTFQSALRFFRDQTESASGGHRQVAGRSPESSSQRTAPQWMSTSSRPPAVPPWVVKPSSSAAPAAEAPPAAAGRTAASPAGRQTAARSRCTVSPRVAGSAPVLARPAEGQPRRSPSHYAHGPESVTAATHSPPPPAPPAPAAVAAGVPTCERIERERQQQERQRRPPTNGRYAGGRNPSRAFQQLAGEYRDEEDDSRQAVRGELRAVGSGQAPRPARPSAVPSRSIRRLQQEYGSQEPEPEPEPEPVRSGPQQTAVIRTTPEQQKQRMAAVSKTYRLLQTDPTAVPSVLGRNGR